MMSERIEKTITHYRIIEKIGRGGMGIVYKGIDERLDRPVAIKFLPRIFSDEPELTDRFVMEARAASALDHPNICTVHEIDETEDNQLFIVMNYYEGESLRQRIRRTGFDCPAAAVTVAVQIAAGLSAAHEKGIIHRDIKPENIWLTLDNTVKILDFGLAKMRGIAVTQEFMTLGTICYAAPEQLRGEPMDERSDIWSLGVVLYEMLSGDTPFDGDNEAALFYSILNEAPRELPDIPAELWQIVQKALARNPKERYQSVAEMHADLQALAPSQGIAGVYTAVRSPFHRYFARRIWIMLIVLTGIALLSLWAYFNVYQKAGAAFATPVRLAVLPFEDLGMDEENAYFADGITEEIIARISLLQNLAVIAKPSSDQFRQKPYDLPVIARKLNVSHVITGSIRKAGEQIRITVQIINLQNETNIWSDTYSRSLEDVFSIQSDIAHNVAEVLQLRLKSAEQRRLRHEPTSNMAAYTLYLKGRYNWNRRSPESLVRALEFFQQAVALDSNFALAYTGIADALALFSSAEYSVMPARQTMSRAKAMVLRAIALDPELAEAHAALANIKMNYDWDFSGAQMSFEKAIDINPNYATAHHWYAILLMIMGQKEKSLEEIAFAQSLDPVSLVINTEMGWLHYYARRYEDAIRQFKETLAVDPKFLLARVNLGMTYAACGHLDSALAEFELCESLSGGHPMIIGLLGYAYAITGQLQHADMEMAQLRKIEENHIYLNPLFPALIYLGQGKEAALMAQLEHAYNERTGYLIYLMIDPLADNIRSHDWFRELVEKIGISKYIKTDNT